MRSFRVKTLPWTVDRIPSVTKSCTKRGPISSVTPKVSHGLTRHTAFLVAKQSWSPIKTSLRWRFAFSRNRTMGTAPCPRRTNFREAPFPLGSQLRSVFHLSVIAGPEHRACVSFRLGHTLPGSTKAAILARSRWPARRICHAPRNLVRGL